MSKASPLLRALKTALDPAELIGPGENAAEFEQFIAAHYEFFKPVGLEARFFLDDLIFRSWMLRRLDKAAGIMPAELHQKWVTVTQKAYNRAYRGLRRISRDARKLRREAKLPMAPVPDGLKETIH